jgi:hypothetical protein
MLKLSQAIFGSSGKSGGLTFNRNAPSGHKKAKGPSGTH